MVCNMCSHYIKGMCFKLEGYTPLIFNSNRTCLYESEEIAKEIAKKASEMKQKTKKKK